MASRKPFLEALLQREGLRREALLVAIYFISRHLDDKGKIPIAQKDLMMRVGVTSAANLTRGVRALVKAGIIEVTVNPEDKRRKLYRLRKPRVNK